MSSSAGEPAGGNKDVYIAAVETHSMRDTLLRYVQPTIHPEIRNRTWKRIIVRGYYEPTVPAIILDCEKLDKPFNWHRPTATIADDGETLSLNCFPGRDYVRHYASLVATYLSLTGRDTSILECQMPEPSAPLQAFVGSNLKDMGEVDTLVVGYVWRLPNLVRRGSWMVHYGASNMFGWQFFKATSQQSVALLGCKPSFWGESSGDLVRALSQLNKAKCIIYIGKAGGRWPDDTPNKRLATGSCSYVGGKVVRWTNALRQEDLDLSPSVAEGAQVTVPTTLCQSLPWLEEWQSKARWVDCEIGYMAEACNEVGIDFGYLHIISDNLNEPHPYNISNERERVVVADRRMLFEEMQRVLQSFLAGRHSADDSTSRASPSSSSR